MVLASSVGFCGKRFTHTRVTRLGSSSIFLVFQDRRNFSDTVAALDLGGASTQVTFLPRDPEVAPFGHVTDVKLYNRHPVKLYTKR